MTLAEFKAWFEGYTEAIDGAPTVAQFDKIKAKVAALEPMQLKPPAPFYPHNTRDVSTWGDEMANRRITGGTLGNLKAVEGFK